MLDKNKISFILLQSCFHSFGLLGGGGGVIIDFNTYLLMVLKIDYQNGPKIVSNYPAKTNKFYFSFKASIIEFLKRDEQIFPSF
jgi:hypothetical protein